MPTSQEAHNSAFHEVTVPGLKIGYQHGKYILAKYYYGADFGWQDRIDTTAARPYPGMAIYRLFDAANPEVPPDWYDRRFLVSSVTRGLAVVTSRLRSGGPQPVTLPQSRDDTTQNGTIRYQIRLVDAGGVSDDSMVGMHNKRLTDCEVNPPPSPGTSGCRYHPRPAARTRVPTENPTR